MYPVALFMQRVFFLLISVWSPVSCCRYIRKKFLPTIVVWTQKDLNSNYMAKAKFDVQNERCDFYILFINICDSIFKICILCHKLTLTHDITEKSLGVVHRILILLAITVVIMIASSIYWALSMEGTWYHMHYMHSLFKSSTSIWGKCCIFYR